ncbi:MAG TPA: ankyrin repeat domain-containing protein [Abditibacteriaceae bacterium]
MNSQNSKAQNEKRFFVIATLVAFGIIAVSGTLRWRAQQTEWMRHDQAAQREARRLAAREAAEKRLALYHKFLQQKEQQRIAGIGVRTALIQAAENGNLPIVRQLLKEGYDPNYEEENDYGYGGPALEAVVGQERYWENSAKRDKAMKDIITIIRLLVRHGAKVKNEKGESSLFHTALQGPGEGQPMRPIIRELLRAGADPNQKFGDVKDPYNVGTPLGSIGHRYGRLSQDERAEIMDDLLRFGARLEGRDWWNRTPLLQVLDKWDAQSDEAVLLLRRGAKVNVRDRNRRTPLHTLFGATPENGITTVDVDLPFVKTILRRGADADARDKNGRTPLHFATENLKVSANNWEYFLEYFSAMRLLLNYGANPNARDDKGQTPLFYIVQGFDKDAHNARFQAARLLLKRGADPNIRDNKSRTPLLVLLKQAAQGKKPDYFAAMQRMAQLLLQNGANADIRAADGTSALSLVQKQKALRALLKQWGATE